MCEQQGWKVDHIGVACRSIEKAIKDYEDLGFQKMHKEIWDGKTQPIRAQFMKLGDIEIELLEPKDENDEKNTLKAYLKTPQYKMYHMCYVVEEFDEAIQYLRKRRYRPVGEEFIDDTHNGRRVIFMIHPKMGLIEIAEKSEGRIS